MDSRRATGNAPHVQRGASAKATIRDAMATTGEGVFGAPTTACPASISPTDPSIALIGATRGDGSKRARLLDDDLGVVLVDPNDKLWGSSSSSSSSVSSTPPAATTTTTNTTTSPSPLGCGYDSVTTSGDASGPPTTATKKQTAFSPTSLDAGVSSNAGVDSARGGGHDTFNLLGDGEEEEEEPSPNSNVAGGGGASSSTTTTNNNTADADVNIPAVREEVAQKPSLSTTTAGSSLVNSSPTTSEDLAPSPTTTTTTTTAAHAQGPSPPSGIPSTSPALCTSTPNESATMTTAASANEDDDNESNDGAGGEDAFRGSNEEVSRLVSESGDNVLPPGPPGTVAIFQPDRFAPSYVKTRHANLRCFPHCAIVHKSRSFCGATVTALVRLGDEISTEQDVYVVGEFRNAQRPPTLKVGDVVEDIRSLLIPAGGGAGDRSPFITGFAIETDIAKKQAVFQLQPRRKWRYDEEVSNPLAVGKLHTISVYVIRAKENRCVGAVDSPKFSLVPAWKANNQRAAAAIRRNDQQQQQYHNQNQLQQQQQQFQYQLQLQQIQQQQQRMFGMYPSPYYFPNASSSSQQQQQQQQQHPSYLPQFAAPPLHGTNVYQPRYVPGVDQNARDAYAMALQQQHQTMMTMMMIASQNANPGPNNSVALPPTVELAVPPRPLFPPQEQQQQQPSSSQPHFLHLQHARAFPYPNAGQSGSDHPSRLQPPPSSFQEPNPGRQ